MTPGYGWGWLMASPKQVIETAVYIENELRALAQMANEAKLKTLVHLVKMAAVEAATVAAVTANRIPRRRSGRR